MYIRCLEGKRGNDHLGDLGLDGGGIIFKWIIKKKDSVCIGLVWVKTLTGGRLL